MPREHYIITSSLKLILHNEKPEIRVAAADHVDYYIDKIEQVAPRARSRTVQLSVDDAIVEAKAVSKEAKNITCTKGCSECCKQVVAITFDEGRRLVQVAAAKGIMPDKAKLERQSHYGEHDWRTQPEEDRACVFLGSDKLCQVYDDRPLSCRKYFVISDPALCNVDVPGQVQVWFSPDAELLTTTAFTQAGCDFMPNVLLSHLHKKDTL
jgi:Fe-S-cluster containining protein